MTKAEVILWMHLRSLREIGYNFRRQHPIGPYISDFAIHAGKLIVEVDGETHGTAEEIAHDQRRDAYLQSKGWRVLRIPNIAIYEDIDYALEVILSHLPLPPRSQRARSHLPRKRGRTRCARGDSSPLFGRLLETVWFARDQLGGLVGTCVR
ncbi:MAG: endonuclease domain-containing protein [Alphaproteobacteria bacterium]|nr:endonuclease domain-containing protein [Alphaproteobacteria bacterium]MBV9979078.1 endonuclease domain-containing protein [Bradyrhizobium sp.]